MRSFIPQRGWLFTVSIAVGLALLPSVSSQTRAADNGSGATEFYALNANGTGWRRLLELESYPACSSPAVSPDGKSIAFDGWKAQADGRQGPTRLLCIGIAEKTPRELCTGQAPSWSPDGKFLACSRSTRPGGVWIMTADGKEHKHIGGGWGAQWSPDGKQIVFYRGPKLLNYDVGSGKVRELLGGNANPYREISWNMGWSPDSTKICFRGIRPDGAEELAIINADGAETGLRIRYATRSFLPDIAWHPHGKRIVFSMLSEERQRAQLFELDPESDKLPTLVAGQDAARDNYNPCWTPDGERLILISRRP